MDSGVRTRQAGSAGVVAAHAGNETRRSRRAQSPPYAPTMLDGSTQTRTWPGLPALPLGVAWSSRPSMPARWAVARSARVSRSADGPSGVAFATRTGNVPAATAASGPAERPAVPGASPSSTVAVPPAGQPTCGGTQRSPKFGVRFGAGGIGVPRTLDQRCSAGGAAAAGPGGSTARPSVVSSTRPTPEPTYRRCDRCGRLAAGNPLRPALLCR
ncbi:hypothetical protein C6W10_12370 [Plantactinospora sp. BB1]|nr:hypothetical protein C6W10_12370 [Plantactinospora sp. BB1]